VRKRELQEGSYPWRAFDLHGRLRDKKRLNHRTFERMREPTAVSPRFVILHHASGRGEHWDLMLEQGEVLRTWQLARSPVGCTDWPIPARPIGDHRKHYLTYEGPVSRDRGDVWRVASGTYTGGESRPGEWEVHLDSPAIAGPFRLVATGEGSFTFRPQPVDD
jgi:hypothetical protein